MSYGEPSNPRESIFIKYWYPALGFATGGFANFYRNWKQNKPYTAALHRYAIFCSVGLAIGQGVHIMVENYIADRDARVNHYIELHPEDFVEKKRKYKELFDTWEPNR